MLQNGQTVYYLINGYIMDGEVFDLQGNEHEYTFKISNLAACEGHNEISSGQIHYTIFLDYQEAKKYQDNPHCYIQSYC
ncbi:MAG: hypothetical protein ACLRT4_12920 [Thomasclavelia sp.]